MADRPKENESYVSNLLERARRKNGGPVPLGPEMNREAYNLSTKGGNVGRR